MNKTVEQNQRDVFAFLQDPKTYGLAESVVRIDTHGAAVFLAGQDVYKVKLAVRYPFMDFSTLEKRRQACEAEIAVNRANAPDLYLGLVQITRDGDDLCLGGNGKAVEWAVHLRRFDENTTLDRLVKKGPLDDKLIDGISQAICAAHRRAPVKDGGVATRALRRLLDETVDDLVANPKVFPAEISSTLGAALTAAFDQAEALLLRRGEKAQVRRCHGDLHLGNIVLVDGAPILFDAIEFDETIATTDILYDLAFVLMDLWKRGQRANANRLLNRYLSSRDDEAIQVEGLSLLPLFLSLRAAIRAKVIAAKSCLEPDNPTLLSDAQAYFDAAVEFLKPVQASLIAIGGLSGTGKTTLAAAMAPDLGRAPGAFHPRSDVERKRLFGAAETVRLPADAYRRDVSKAIYENLGHLAEIALRAGQSVIVDATHQNRNEREAIAAVASRAEVPFLGLWLEAPVETLKQRVTERQGDASDATAEVVAIQVKTTASVPDWRQMDASQSIATLKTAALDFARGSPR